MSRAEKSFKEGRFYIAAQQYDLAALIRPNSPLSRLGGCFANFASELLVLFGSWKEGANNPMFYLYTVLAAWGIVISAVYLLRAVRWTFFGPLNPTWEGKVEDAKGFVWRAPFVLLIFVLALAGCYPKIILDLIDGSVQPIVEGLNQVRQLAGK